MTVLGYSGNGMCWLCLASLNCECRLDRGVHTCECVLLALLGMRHVLSMSMQGRMCMLVGLTSSLRCCISGHSLQHVVIAAGAVVTERETP